KCRGCVEHTATKTTTGVINKKISDVTILVVNRKKKIYERNRIRSDYQESEKRKERGRSPDSTNNKHRPIDNVENQKYNMAKGREAGVD
ncbi:25625_t:CDS:2, partial [Gigaspora margarita]